MSTVQVFDELGSEVYEMPRSVPVETAEEAPIRDNGRTEAILNLCAIDLGSCNYLFYKNIVAGRFDN